MLSLILRLVGLFAFRSKRILYLALGLAGLGVVAVPALLRPAWDYVSAGSRLDFIVKLNGVDRAKMREPVVRERYDRFLKEISRTEPAIKTVDQKPVKKFFDHFSCARLPTFIVGALLWVILGIVGLLANDVNVPGRLGTLGIFLALGFAAGIGAEYLPALAPFSILAVAIVAIEVVLLSLIGTLAREVNGRG